MRIVLVMEMVEGWEALSGKQGQTLRAQEDGRKQQEVTEISFSQMIQRMK